MMWTLVDVIWSEVVEHEVVLWCCWALRCFVKHLGANKSEVTWNSGLVRLPPGLITSQCSAAAGPWEKNMEVWLKGTTSYVRSLQSTCSIFQYPRVVYACFFGVVCLFLKVCGLVEDFLHGVRYRIHSGDRYDDPSPWAVSINTIRFFRSIAKGIHCILV